MPRVSTSLHILAVLLLSGFLVSLAWPRLHASWLYLPVDTAIGRYYDSRETPSGQVEGLQQRALEAIAVHPHYRYHDGLSLLYFLQGTDHSFPLHQRRQAFEDAITAAENSLSLAPAQPRTWLRIAQARSWLFYPVADVIEPLEMAMLTGRVEPSMFMTRLILGFAYADRMNDNQRAMLRDQLLLAWSMQKNQVVRAVKRGDVKISVIEVLLEGAHENTLSEIKEATVGSVR